MIKDNTENLKIGLKAEQDTVAQYTKFLNSAKQANNKSEADLWQHIIDDELEHIKELEAALNGEFNLHDSEESECVVVASDNPHINYNMFVYNTDQIRTFYAKGEVYIAFEGTEEECNNWVEQAEAEDEEAYPDAGGDLTNYIVLKSSDLNDHYKIDKAYNMKRNKKNAFGDDSERMTIRIIPQEEIDKRQQQIEEFEDDIIDCLSDAGIERRTYSLSNEWPHFYVDFDYKEDEGIAAYNALRDSFFKCDFVDDDGFYYVHVLRR